MSDEDLLDWIESHLVDLIRDNENNLRAIGYLGTNGDYGIIEFRVDFRSTIARAIHSGGRA